LHADVEESTPTTRGTYFSALGCLLDGSLAASRDTRLAVARSRAAGPLGHGTLNPTPTGGWRGDPELGGIPAS
jgi:hypothetical protein